MTAAWAGLLMVGSAIAVLPIAPTRPAAASSRQPVYFPDFTYERLRVPMRDDVELSIDLWRPVVPGKMKVPVILTLTPYHVLNRALDPVNETDLPSGDAALFVPKGYAYVMADVRGTYNSGGCWDYGGINERHDGYDLVEWLGTQDWSNGKVAMTGASYDGTTANAAAVEQPPHLATIIPVSSISRWWGYAYQQGARSTYSGEDADIDPPSDTPTDFMFAYGFLPPLDPGAITHATQLAMRWDLCDRVEKAMHGYSTDPDYDKFWVERDYLRLAKKVKVPVLVSHGLLDFNVKTWEGTAWFQALRTQKAMVLGQWPHASPRGRWVEWDAFLERWLERWLYGVHNGVENEPAVYIQSSDGQWRSQESWGAGPTKTLKLEGGSATIVDDGLLTESEMVRAAPGGRFVRSVVTGSEGLHIEGRPILDLTVASDSPSTHLVAVLCDAGPSGGCKVISRAFLHARYRDSLAQGKDLEPGKAYRMRLEFIDKDYTLAADHHLELLIASSSTTWVASDVNRATNTISLDKSRLSVPLAAN